MNWLLLPLLSAATAADDLAPGPAELAAHRQALDARLDRAEALQTAVTRLQGALAEHRATGQALDCTDPAVASAMARLQIFGPAWRDAAQSARAARVRLDGVVAAPTVQPVLDDQTQAEIEALRRRSEAQATIYQEAVAWHELHLGRVRGCPADPAPAPGLPDEAPDLQGPAAVYVAGAATLCPAGEAVEDQVVIADGPICLGDDDCTCVAEPVAPGAVLAP